MSKSNKRPFIIWAFLFFLPWLLAPAAHAQSITGYIYDAQSKEALPGAAIRQAGTSRGVVSQDNGFFSFQLSENGDKSIIVSYLGYKTQVIEVSEQSGALNIFMFRDTYIGEDIFVQSVRVDEAMPITYNNLEKTEIEQRNLGQDVPYLLQNLPSVITTSDAGAGVGYTGIRIRGVDPSRINITLNGIPVNDAESHSVFWVNLPDLASSVQNIQVQRGVGTSTNGAGAFGATINLQTGSSQVEPFTEVNTSYGSFNTQKYNAKVGTGLMKNGWQFEGRLSNITSDGYVDRASSDLNSWFLSAAHHGSRSLLKADVFSGKEVTYQSWYGVEESMLQTNRRFNEAGTEKPGSPYQNQVDNYQQNYYQLHYSYQLMPQWTANASVFYTQGFGYYEEYKAEQELANYGISPLNPADPAQSDLIRRRWLDNDFYGLILSSKYSTDTWNVQTGGGVNRYAGRHFGEVIWARYAGNSEHEEPYYDNDAEKIDYNAYTKFQYKITDALNTYLDVQLRGIRYEFLGNGFVQSSSGGLNPDSLISIQQTDDILFFNPKFGLVYTLPGSQRLYASFAVSGKEPTRDEYVDSTPQSRPKPEKLYNVEAGYDGNFDRFFLAANLYGMFYKDQLVLTGQINDVGAFIRQNVPQSYRIGLELQGGFSLTERWSLSANATLSQNKIVEYTQYTDMYDAAFNWTGQQAEVYKQTDIAFSPALIANGIIAFTEGAFSGEFISKYVSRQYMDNTQNRSRSLDPYLVNDIRLNYRLSNIPVLKSVTATLQVNNVFNALYESNGFTFGWLEQGTPVHYNYYYPQAGTNFLLQLKWAF